jgi:hypothetical protein
MHGRPSDQIPEILDLIFEGPSSAGMRSMRSMRGGIIFRNRGPSLKVHHGQCPTRMSTTVFGALLGIWNDLTDGTLSGFEPAT